MLVRLPSRAASGRQGSREVPTTIPDPRELLKASSVPHPGGPPPTQHPLWPGPARWSIPTGKSMGGRGRLCGKAPPTPPHPRPRCTFQDSNLGSHLSGLTEKQRAPWRPGMGKSGAVATRLLASGIIETWPQLTFQKAQAPRACPRHVISKY